MLSGGSPATRRFLSVARVLLALGILAWVASKLPWEDELVYRDENGTEHVAEGVIEGDWKADTVRFRPEEGEIGPAWPLGVREPAARGAPIVARRKAADETQGFDWHPGMPHAFREMDVPLLLTAQALFLVAAMTIITRWWRLLALAGCPTSWWNALRLTFLGLFFNNVMPGATGGDLVKGAMVARENRGRAAEALVTVFVDRVFGMLALAVLALVVILVRPGEFGALRPPLLYGLGLTALGVALYSSKTFRRKTGLSALVDRLPLGAKLRSLDRAAMIYLRAPRPMAVAFAFSFVNHILVTLGVYCLGRSLGVSEGDVSLQEYFVLVPVANLISAVPVAPGGWGVGELAYSGLFLMIGASGALGVAVSVTFRLSQLAIGLLGGLFLLVPGSRPSLGDAPAA